MERWHVTGQTAVVTFDGGVVTITRIGLARLSPGGADQQIPVDAIAAVRLRPAGLLLHGFIHFARHGATRPPASGDERSVVFSHRQAAAFEELRDAVERATAGPQLPSGSVADELTKLARLVEQELLTREEFETQKARLLNH